jgi:hypothetical protein
MVNLIARVCYDCGVCTEKARRQQALEKEAEALVASLTKFVNGMSREATDALATALANEHPTLSGQVAKAVGMGIIRRSTRNPDWKPGQPTVGGESGVRYCESSQPAIHPEHDGRHTCETVVGAYWMSHQPLI